MPSLLMKAVVEEEPRWGRKRKMTAAVGGKGARARKGVAAGPVAGAKVAAAGPAQDSRIEDLLGNWRMAEAKRRGVPAFRIFNDQALRAMAVKRPATAAELLAIPGIGISIVEKYGAQIYRLLHEGRGAS